MLTMRWLPLACWGLSFNLAAAQTQSQGDAEADSQGVCRELVESGNATGSSGTVDNGVGVWRVSVQSNYSANSLTPLENVTEEESFGAVASLWLDPSPSIDLNWVQSFSACAFVFRYLPENTIRRGQDDDGSCEQTLSRKCVQQLSERAEETAYWLVANPTVGPFSNLTVRISLLIHALFSHFTDPRCHSLQS